MCLYNSPKRTGGAFVEKNRGFMNIQNRRTLKSIVFSLLVFAGLSLSAIKLDATTQTDDLNTKIGVLHTTTNNLNQDVPGAYQRLKALAHLTQGSLIAGAVQTDAVGSTFDWPITFTTSGTSISGFQFDFPIPSSFTIVSVTAGPAVLAATKSIASQVMPGNIERIIAFGLNQNPIGSGIAAIVRFKLASPPKGLYPLSLMNPIGTDASGTPTILSAMSGTVVVQ